MRIETPKDLLREVNAALRNRDVRINQLNERINQIRIPMPDNRSGEDGLIQRQLNYTQVVLVLGYGGFLTLWSAIYDRVPSWAFGLTGSLLVLSLLAFILSELWMAWGYVRLAKQAKKLSKFQLDEAVEAHRLATAANGPVIFLAAAVPGVLGGGILLSLYLVSGILGNWK